MNLPSANLASTSAMLTESPLRDLEAIIRSRTPLIAMESNEEPQIVRMVREIAQKFQLKAFRVVGSFGFSGLQPLYFAGFGMKLRDGRIVMGCLSFQVNKLHPYFLCLSALKTSLELIH
jgi:hypothetical protein